MADHINFEAELPPCPFCGADLEPFGLDQANHPSNSCWLRAVRVTRNEFGAWSSRITLSAKDEKDRDLPPHATGEILALLGQPDPFSTPEQKPLWFERLCRVRATQQPLPVPKGAVVIWRTDLVQAVAELIQLRAYRDLIRKDLARANEKGQG